MKGLALLLLIVSIYLTQVANERKKIKGGKEVECKNGIKLFCFFEFHLKRPLVCFSMYMLLIKTNVH